MFKLLLFQSLVRYVVATRVVKSSPASFAFGSGWTRVCPQHYESMIKAAGTGSVILVNADISAARKVFGAIPPDCQVRTAIPR